jgi:peptide deformylase
MKKYDAELATIDNHYNWVKARAREILLTNELDLARELDIIMRHFREQHHFIGVSSNNIYWNLTPVPIRQILIPIKERQYISLINPEIIRLEGEDIQSIEGCGSIPNEQYVVKRKPYCAISGYTLEEKHIELEYGSKDYYTEQALFASCNHKEWIIQHEMDHLDGITIKDKGIKFNLQEMTI